MKDKKDQPEILPSNIMEIELPDDEILGMFPTCDISTVRILAVLVNWEHMAYLAMDFPPGDATILHLYIKPEYIHTDNILEMKNIFYDRVLPWAKDQGRGLLVVQCSTEDKKTEALIRSFGFELTPVFLGVMLTGE